MKTKSITSFAALLGAALALNLSAVAGPGPHDPPVSRKARTEKKVAVTTYKEWKAPIAERTAAKSRPMGSLAVAARGNAYGF